ncbi:MAG: NAD(P)H-dependent oxidoreductase subunit E [Tepidiformaceae bacterium]
MPDFTSELAAMHPEPTTAELRALVAEFQPGEGHVMPALHKVQDAYGYISREAIEVIARQLNSTPALIFGAVSYYSDYRTHRPPATEVTWCSGPACRLRGGDRIRQAIEHTFALPLGAQDGEGRYGLHLGQCNGTCHEAPQVWVNGQVAGNLSIASAIRLARAIREGE